MTDSASRSARLHSPASAGAECQPSVNAVRATRRNLLLAAPALIGGGFATRTARAQEAWPPTVVTFVVPGPAGGTGDVISRAISPMLQQSFGRPAVVDNRPGANGEVGTRFVTRSKPDGCTVLMGSIGHFAINFALRPSLSYDPVKELAPITLAATTPNVLVVNPQAVPVTDLPSLLQWMRNKGERVSYATSGIGSSDQLTMELFKQITGTKALHDPYPGGPPALTDLMGGSVDMAFFNLGNVTNHVREGRLRAVLITSAERSPLLPAVPTGRELGLTELVVTSWQGVAVPAGVPAPVIARLNKDIVAALRDNTVIQRLGDLGFTVVANGPDEFRSFQLAEIERWRSLIERQGIRAE